MAQKPLPCDVHLACWLKYLIFFLFSQKIEFDTSCRQFAWNIVCVEVLRPSQPNGVSLPNHTFTGQAKFSTVLTNIVHILSPETDNFPSWISGRERMTIENISRSISIKECCRPWRGLNPQPPSLHSDGASNWATEVGLHEISNPIKYHPFLPSAEFANRVVVKNN